jgi:hypothetical protein
MKTFAGHTIGENSHGYDDGRINQEMDGKLIRNSLKGALGDALHAVMCGAGHNMRKLRLLCAQFRVALQEVLQIISASRQSNYGGAV